MFTVHRLERYAIRAEDMIQQSEGWYVNIDEVGSSLGMSAHESRFFAKQLELAGWVKIHGNLDAASKKLIGCLAGLALGAAVVLVLWRTVIIRW